MITPVPCKCSHAQAKHIGGVGLCTDVTCACDSYVPRLRAISDEATDLALKTASAAGFTGDAATFKVLADVLQDLIDQRVSWEREAAKLLAQREYAERRTNEVERSRARMVDSVIATLRSWLDMHDSGQPAPGRPALRGLIAYLEGQAP